MAEDKARLIVNDIKNEEGTNPVAIFERMAKKDYPRNQQCIREKCPFYPD